MPLDASIPLQSASPLQSIGSLMQIRGQMADFATKQAQAADLRAQADQRNRDLNDQNTVQQLMNDPALAPKIAGGDLSSLHGRVQPKTLEALQTGLDAHQTKLLANNESTNKEAAEDLGAITNTLQGLKEFAANDANEGKLAEASAQAIATLHAQNRFRHLAPGTNIPDMFTDPSQIDVAAAHVGAFSQMTDKALSVQKARRDNEYLKQEAADKEATAGKATAETKGIEQENDLRQFGLDAARAELAGEPSQLGNVIDRTLPPELDAQANAGFKQAYLAALKTKDPLGNAAAVVKVAAEHAASVSNEMNPAVQAAKAKQAGMNARATAPVEIEKAVQTEIQKARLAPGAVSGILNPTLQAKVIGDWTKAGDEYQSKIGDAQRLHDFVEAARSGNQSAAALIPLAEVREIVNRVNSQELSAAGGGTSWARKVQNWIDKGATGVPSSETLNEMDQVASKTLDAAKRVWAGKVTNLNTLGAKFPTEPPDVKMSSTPATSGATSYKAGDTRVINGVTYTRDDKGNWHPK